MLAGLAENLLFYGVGWSTLRRTHWPHLLRTASPYYQSIVAVHRNLRLTSAFTSQPSMKPISGGFAQALLTRLTETLLAIH